MKNIKILIVEDKLLVAEGISAVLRKHALEVAGMCDTGEEAITLAHSIKPDLILMDIELSGAMDGISAARVIQEHHAIPVIYLTDYTDKKTFDRAKKTLPAQYITKPFQEADLVRAIELAFYNTNADVAAREQPLLEKHVFLKEKEAFIKLAYDEILYLEADRAYCNVVTEQKTYKLSGSMKHIYKQINNKDFVKVHRSYVINANKITALDGNTIKLGSHEVQMSKDFREDLTGRLTFLK